MPRDDTIRRVTPLRDEADQKSDGVAALQNIEAEQALLGAILVNNDAYQRVVEIVRPGDFANAVHGRIFTALATLIDRGEIANPVTLKLLFDQDGALSSIGGAKYLATLVDSAITVINAPYYAREIRKLSDRRALLGIYQEAIADIRHIDLNRTAAEIIGDVDAQLIEINEGGAGGGLKPASITIDAALAAAELTYQAEGKITGIPTGLTGLDDALGGLHASDFIIIAGRPSMGKSDLLLTIAYAAARDNHPVQFFSLEMPAKQLMARLLARGTGVSAQHQRRRLSRDQMFILIEEGKRLKRLIEEEGGHRRALPLLIDDTPSVTVAYMRRAARRYKRQHGHIGLIAVDYLQLLVHGAENRFQEVSAISRELKALAKELDVPVVAACQLSRKVEDRDNKRPMLSDLRESGQIEQDADIIIFPYREEAYLVHEEPRRGAKQSEAAFNASFADWSERLRLSRGKAELIIAKNRLGTKHTEHVHFDGARSRFYDKAHETPDDT